MLLKKAGIVVATAAAAALAMSPLAFAGDKSGDDNGVKGAHHNNNPFANVVDVNNQENEQESEQGNGILNGNNIVGGNSINVCDVADVEVRALISQVIAILTFSAQDGSGDVDQSAGSCDATATAVGQDTVQGAQNTND